MKVQEEFPMVRAGLIEAFGNVAWITLKQLSEYDGSDVRTIRTRYGIPKGVNGINRDILASRICKLAAK